LFGNGCRIERGSLECTTSDRGSIQRQPVSFGPTAGFGWKSRKPVSEKQGSLSSDDDPGTGLRVLKVVEQDSEGNGQDDTG
jgi:hypothetical protein